MWHDMQYPSWYCMHLLKGYSSYPSHLGSGHTIRNLHKQQSELSLLHHQRPPPEHSSTCFQLLQHLANKKCQLTSQGEFDMTLQMSESHGKRAQSLWVCFGPHLALPELIGNKYQWVHGFPVERILTSNSQNQSMNLCTSSLYYHSLRNLHDPTHFV